MLTYTSRRTAFGNYVNNSSATTLTLADGLMNDCEKRILSSRAWPFLEKQYTLTTLASTQAYNLPAYANRAGSIYVTIGNYRYSPREVSSRQEWDSLNQFIVTADIPTHWYEFDGQLLLYPKPSSAGNTITVNCKKIWKDLSIADYTTGGVLTAANGSTSLVGTGTTWAVSMAGRWIRITESDTVNKGDGVWYEIASSASATAITLVRAYAGTSITAGNAAYTIGQVSLLPEPYDQLPILEALKIYFTSIEPNQEKATLYTGLAKESYGQLVEDYGSKGTSVVIDDGEDRPFTNPNLTVTL